MKSLLLASTSPRRQELMALTGFPFTVCSPDCDENIGILSPDQYVLELSRRKSLAGVRMAIFDSVVIGADTIVYHDGTILGKPQNETDAFSMLTSLSGETHSVYTGVTLTDTATLSCRSFYEKTDVTFYDVTEDEIRAYISTGEPMDKAGAYGIQGRGVFLVRQIHGDYNNVVGLPVARLIRELKTFV